MSDLTVDGVDMKTLAKNVETLAATLRTPARRGTNAVTAGRSGVIRTPDKLHEAPVYVWPMWVVGTDDDGSIPTDSSSAQQFRNNVDDLTALFGKDGVLDVRHTQPGSITADVTNLVTNPSGRNTSGTVVVRENLVTNPNPRVDSGWSAQGQATLQPLVVGPTPVGNNYRRITGTGVAGWARLYLGVPISVSAGAKYTFSSFIRSSRIVATGNGLIGIIWKDASNVLISESPLFPGVPVANVWDRVSVTATAPVNASTAFLYVGWAVSQPIQSGDTFDACGVLFEKSPGLADYFDGTTPAAGDFTYAWSGAADASTSKQLAPSPVNWYTIGASSTDVVYKSSIGVTVYSPYDDGSSGVGALTPTITLNDGDRVRWAGRVRSNMAGVLTAVLERGAPYTSISPISIQVDQPDAWVPFDVSAVITAGMAGSSAYGAGVYGTSIAGRTITIESMLAVEGDYTGDYFDGSSGPGFTWDGEPDASTSTAHADVRQADCECLAAIDFSTFGADPTGKFAVELQNLNAYWADTFDTVAVLAPDAHDMPEFLGATAPLDDAVLVVTGPATNPRIEDYNKGSYIQYNDVIAAGQTLTIDADSMTLEGSGGLVPDFSKLQIVGMAGRMFRLVPAYKAGYAARLTASATSAATSLSITGRRKYLVG